MCSEWLHHCGGCRCPIVVQFRTRCVSFQDPGDGREPAVPAPHFGALVHTQTAALASTIVVCVSVVCCPCVCSLLSAVCCLLSVVLLCCCAVVCVCVSVCLFVVLLLLQHQHHFSSNILRVPLPRVNVRLIQDVNFANVVMDKFLCSSAHKTVKWWHSMTFSAVTNTGTCEESYSNNARP